MMESTTVTIGSYLAQRFVELGLEHYFAIPGDYNLVLLDELLKQPKLQMIGCCNELNAGYAADGYARARGLAALVVTYSVGGLSALNAVAGAYAEDLPIIVISGAPNTNSENENQFLHHTLGEVDYHYVQEIFRRITAKSVIVRHLADAPSQIDEAIEAALCTRKPVYLEIACNIAGLPISAPCKHRFDAHLASDPGALEDAVEQAAAFLNAAVKPVLVAGSKLRAWSAVDAFGKLADASGYAVAAMPDAKGLFSEAHPQYIGTYWGPVGSPGCDDIVESSDALLYAGPRLTDYTTTGNCALIDPTKLIHVRPHEVSINNRTFCDVAMPHFLAALAEKVQRNATSLNAFARIREEVLPTVTDLPPDTPISTRALFAHIQQMLDGESALIAETGDSWFNTMSLKLPAGATYEIQMQYGSIGWSVGATLGYALGAGKTRRPIACIGDGSFQMTAQEISTMIRYDVKPIIFLMNNRGYTIEVEIHDGPYNDIKNWDYAKLVDAFAAGEGKAKAFQVRTVGQVRDAIAAAREHDGLCLIEVQIDRDDCNRHLLSWGSHVAKCNGRAPAVP